MIDEQRNETFYSFNLLPTQLQYPEHQTYRLDPAEMRGPCKKYLFLVDVEEGSGQQVNSGNPGQKDAIWRRLSHIRVPHRTVCLYQTHSAWPDSFGL